MTDNTWALLISSLVGVVSYLVRWAVGQVTTAMNASTEARITHAAALAKQSEAFTFVRQELSDLGEKVGEVHEWCMKTPPAGTRRHKTEPKGTPT